MHAGVVHVIDDVMSAASDLGVDVASRVAVLASGSNAAPARLGDKCGQGATVPVLRLDIPDTAAVYSAHVTRYGSIAANRIRHVGSVSSLHIPLLDADQLALVDRSEGSYRRVLLADGVPGYDGPVWFHKSWRGVLESGGSPIRVEEVPAASHLGAATQIEVLDYVAVLTATATDGQALSAGVVDGTIDPEAVNGLLNA